MRVWYLLHMRATKGQMSLHIRAISPQPLLFALKKKRCRWRLRPTFVPFKAVVLLLLIYYLMFPHWIVGAQCLVLVFMHYWVFFLVLQSSCRWRESMITCLHCLPTISVLWLFLTVLSHFFHSPVQETLVFNRIYEQRRIRRDSRFAQSRQSLCKSY